MRGFLIALAVVVLLGLLAWWAGWLNFADSGDGKQIEIDKQEFKRDVDEAKHATDEAIRKADEAVDEATNDSREPRMP